MSKEILLSVVADDNILTIVANHNIYKYKLYAEWYHECWINDIEGLEDCLNNELLEIDNRDWQITIKTSGGYCDISGRTEWGYSTWFDIMII